MTRRSLAAWPLLAALLGNASIAAAKEWPGPIKALEAQGVEIVATFPAPGGLTGYAAISQQQPLPIYLTADRKHVLVGTLFDSTGKNLSEEPLERLVSAPLNERIWKQLEASRWIGDGSDKAPRIVYTFTDPNCPYCNKLWKDARPWVAAGKVQLRHIIVGILGPTSPGKAAALLAADDPKAALAQHAEQHASGGIRPLAPIPAAARAQLDANQRLMHQLGSQATPSSFYKDATGKLQKLDGAPSPERLAMILGPK